MRKLAFIFIAFLLLASCDNGDAPDPTPPAPVEPTGVITLTSPVQNSICITGTVLSANQSAVELKWDKFANATSYTVTIKDLLNNTVTNFTTDQNQYTANLNRNTPYSWSVTAQASVSPKTAKSESWKFYNAGSGITSYAPFPADNLSPNRDQVVTTVAGKTTLTWTGSDADNDILNYDIYLGTTTTLTLLKREVIETKLENVELISKASYYWKVVTRDKNGNTSESVVIPFTVK
ncbi:MAG: hypothetical protein EOO91_01320 [Pedobacter sp.]|nr:MAG: hypothetical protein EOO91_01320 [Pedobacter sp.]